MIALLSPNCSSLVPYAKQLLEYFVMSFQQIYGKHFVSHKVHGLLHLCDDYDNYGPLDNCSSFLFENYMKELKSLVKKPDKPLQQVVNRYSEIYSSNKTSVNFLNSNKDPEFKWPHKFLWPFGPLINNINGQQYNTMIFGQFKINVEQSKDCFFLTNIKKWLGVWT